MPGLNLTRTEAEHRSQTVNPSTYSVLLDLTTGDQVFSSTTTITFSAAAGAETFVDLVAQKIHSITLNGNPIDPTNYRNNRIQLTDLQENNVFEVQADCLYMHSGEGLHSFVDPSDGERYCYSQFEVPDARRVFATFEQPDLKASFQFSVVTPPEWTVFSNSLTPVPVSVDQGLRFDFEPTQVISTYITAIVAGPYVGKTSSLVSTDGREIPLGVYCRRSLEEHLDADDIFDLTREGFAFFEAEYGIPYPFTKYDQIFVPEYNAGAMENAGCITFRDQYIFRSQPTEWELENRANTILHELAHMWFGDLVTMEWWNDLWLNESFAEFMSHLALAEGTKYKDAWIGFTSRKEWGLGQDQLPSTHPIKAEIRDLQDVEVNFDGITYAKGASVLRQLVSYVGRENFFKGLHEYLTKNSYANATLDDLLGELETASGRDLRAWSKVWLEEAGVTTLSPIIEVDDNNLITRAAVAQTVFTDGASLRPHRLAVAGYSLGENNEITQVFREELDVSGSETEIAGLVGTPRPDLILVNDGDLAYAKLRLDQQSLEFAVANIQKFNDPLTRRVILSAAWDMTRDGEMSATEYVQLALQAVPSESYIGTLTSLLLRIDAALGGFTALENRSARTTAAADRLILLAKSAAAGTDQQKLLVRALARTAVSREQFEVIKGIYDGTTPLHGLDVDLDLQWSLLISLVRAGLASEADIARQLEKDSSMTGEQKAAHARASIDSETIRAHTWNEVLHNTEIANDTRWEMLAGFWAHVETEPLAYTEYVDKFFDQIVQVWNAHTFHIASVLIEDAFPTSLSGYLPGISVVEKAQIWLDQHQDQPDALRRLVIEGQADAQRMIIAQHCDASR